MAAEHGTHSAYVLGCRCADCTAANRDYMRAYRQRRRTGGNNVGDRAAEPARTDPAAKTTMQESPVTSVPEPALGRA